MYPVKLTGRHVQLREFAEDDDVPLLSVYGDPAVTSYLSFEPRDQEQVTAVIAAARKAAQQAPRAEYSLAAAHADGGGLIGFARLAVDTQQPGQSSAQIGFALSASQQGQGLGTETVQLLLQLGFGELGLHRIWGARAPGNEVSAHVMSKLGMAEEGRIRGHLEVRGHWRDSIVHSILEDEWQAPSAVET